MTKIFVLLIVALLFFTGLDAQSSSSSSSTFCANQQNGVFCEGAFLVTCKNKAETSRTQCTGTCDTVSSVFAVCSIASTSNLCSGKSDGTYCDGNNVVTCSNHVAKVARECDGLGNCTQRTPTFALCLAAETPAPQPETFCTGMADGSYCDGDNLVICSNGNVNNTTTCDNGCSEDNNQASCSAPPVAAPVGFCVGRGTGNFCNHTVLVACTDGNETIIADCATQDGSAGCTQLNETSAQCAIVAVPTPPEILGFCSNRADGVYCNGTVLTQCLNGTEESSTDCLAGNVEGAVCVQVSQNNATCQAPTPSPTPVVVPVATFCTGRADGTYCALNNNIIACVNNSVATNTSCPLDPSTNTFRNCVQQTTTQAVCQVPVVQNFCTSLADGSYCNGNAIVVCSGGVIASSSQCANGCTSTSNNPSVAGAICNNNNPATFCQNKGNTGLYCLDANTVVRCDGSTHDVTIFCSGSCQERGQEYATCNNNNNQQSGTNSGSTVVAGCSVVIISSLLALFML